MDGADTYLRQGAFRDICASKKHSVCGASVLISCWLGSRYSLASCDLSGATGRSASDAGYPVVRAMCPEARGLVFAAGARTSMVVLLSVGNWAGAGSWLVPVRTQLYSKEIKKLVKIYIVRPRYYTHLITPPLALGYLSSALKMAGYQPLVIDGLNLGLSNKELADRCDGADVVGITCCTPFLSEVTDLTAQLKRRKAMVVIGGPHPTFLPQETRAQTGCDYIVVGEGEQTFPELLDSIAAGRGSDDIPGVVGESGKLIPRNPIQNLDDISWPDWSTLHPSSYPLAPYGGVVRRFPVAPVASTRGCAAACKFCCVPRLSNRRVRFRSPKDIVDEIRMLVRDHGIREVQLIDDNMAARTSHMVGFCEELLRAEISVPWSLPSGIRVDNVSSNLFRLMRRSGCYSVAFGIETGVQRVLDRIGKGIRVEQVERAVRDAHQAGLITQGFFILGLPGDDRWTIEQTLDFARRLPLDKAQFLLLDPLPGSAFWDELIYDQPSSSYRSFQEAIWTPDGMTKEELMKLQAYAFRRFFSKPSRLLRMLRMIKPRQVRFVIRRMRDFGIFSRWRVPRPTERCK